MRRRRREEFDFHELYSKPFYADALRRTITQYTRIQIIVWMLPRWHQAP